MLAKRELSAAQVRVRLTDKGFAATQVEEAVRRLQAESAIDDRRTAAAYARQAVTIKMRGRKRTLRELHDLGIGDADAREAVNDAYAEVDEGALLESAISGRLDGPIKNRAQFRRLYQSLLRQGFEGDAVVAALMAKAEVSAQSEND